MLTSQIIITADTDVTTLVGKTFQIFRKDGRGAFSLIARIDSAHHAVEYPSVGIAMVLAPIDGSNRTAFAAEYDITTLREM